MEIYTAARAGQTQRSFRGSRYGPDKYINVLIVWISLIAGYIHLFYRRHR